MDIREMIQALKRVGFSQEAIAFGIQANKSTVSRIVTGKTNSPRYILANRVEQLFLEYCK